MKTFRYLTMAVLSLAMVACSNDITSERPAENLQGKGIPFSATISMRGSATRSVMTENSDKTISAVWETGDELALVYEVAGKKQVTKAKMTVADDKSATITATLAEGVTAGSKVKLLYPYAAVCDDAEEAEFGAMKKDSLQGQDGTLEKIAKNYDLCEGAGEFTLSSAGTASLKDDVAMKSLIAIWKISLSDGSKALKTQQLLIYKDNDMENMLANVILDSGAEATDVFYIAVSAFENAQIGMQAPIGTETYYYDKGGVTLEAGKFYQSTVTLADMLHTPLTLEAAVAGAKVTFKANNNDAEKTIEYSTDGVNWTAGNTGGDGVEVTLTNVGDKVMFRGNNTTYSSVYDKYNAISCTADCYVYGNIMSLISADNFATLKELTATYTFNCLFRNNTHLKNHPNAAYTLELPATKLTDYCYRDMFLGCESLVTPPALPAEELKKGCYSGMFLACSALATAPALPATSLAENCYNCMFMSCTSLEATPKLPATELKEACYYGMFEFCTSLKEAWVKADYKAGNPGYECQYMFTGCPNAATSQFHTGDSKANWTAAFPELSDWQFSAYE